MDLGLLSGFVQGIGIFFKKITGKPLILGLIAGLILSLVLGGLTDEVLEQESIVDLDKWVLEHTSLVQSPGLTRAMIFITELGGVYFIWPLTAVSVAWLIYRRRREETKFVASVMAGGGILNLVLKNAIQRARPIPPGGTELVQVWGWAYPSGHAFLSVVFYFSAAYFISRRSGSKIVSLLAFAAAFCISCAVALSRVYLQVHYLSDVLAGFLAGLTWFVLCLAILENARGKAIK
ncbi:MAG: phosphatase PAP2 family protein [Syntrophaceae bacterium]